MKRAFTLVELLVTIVIVGMLAMMSMAALRVVQSSARISRTQATIAKIDTYIMEQYESYRARRLPFNPTSGAYAAIPSIQDPLDPTRRLYFTDPEVAGRRLDVLRDLMRLEMPDRWNDVGDQPLTLPWTNGAAWSQKPAITLRIQAKYLLARNALLTKGKTAAEADAILARYASAKLLYMVVMGHNPEAAEHFRSDEIARPTEDGLPVFVDAWGNPIKWLRWAPGCDQSDFQPVVSPIDDTTARSNAANASPDPLNPKKAYRHAIKGANLTAPFTTDLGWMLAPLIYSAGPDGIYDVSVGDSGYHYTGNPYQYFTTETPAFAIGSGRDSQNTSETVGVGVAANGSADHYDNITNHIGMVR
jgi:prepilin-type N-terminal cleavage/methylation domain-containing protein